MENIENESVDFLEDQRPETGPMEFEDDWRGIFIRGDDALMSFVPFLMILKDRLEKSDVLYTHQIEEMIEIFKSANHHGSEEKLQKMKSFSQCKIVSLPVVR